MKTLLITPSVRHLAISACLVSGLFAQPLLAQNLKEEEVPSHVREALAKRYPTATDLRWEREDGGFEGAYKAKGKEVSVFYSAAGTFLRTEFDIAVKKLPANIVEALNQVYPENTIRETARMENANGTTSYKVLIEHKGKSLYVVLSTSGKIEETSLLEK
jgi:hypothetical protein